MAIRNPTLSNPKDKCERNALPITKDLIFDKNPTPFTYNLKSNANLGFYEKIKHKLTLSEVGEVIDLTLQYMRDQVVNTEEGILLPCRLGALLVVGIKTGASNYRASKNNNKTVGYMNYETDGYVFRTLYKHSRLGEQSKNTPYYLHPYILSFKTTKSQKGLRVMIKDKIVNSDWHHWRRFSSKKEAKL